MNSYKRLASSDSASGTTWSPVWKAYGANNRTCLVRVVDGRLEWRLPDPSCNVYAAIAATLVAGLQGIDRAMQPPPPVADDLYLRAQAGQDLPPALPVDLREALRALQNDLALREGVGEAFCSQFLQLKRAEWAAYSQHISSWEMARYAHAF